MTKEALVAVFIALTGVPDNAGHPIRRPVAATTLVAEEVLASSIPSLETMAYLDVLGARESGWDSAAVGDGGKSCGMFQTPCDSTPMPPGWKAEFEAAKAMPRETAAEREARDKALALAHRHRADGMTVEMKRGQIRRALSILKKSIDDCPGHPIWEYASGECKYSNTANTYEGLVKGELSLIPAP